MAELSEVRLEVGPGLAQHCVATLTSSPEDIPCPLCHRPFRTVTWDFSTHLAICNRAIKTANT